MRINENLLAPGGRNRPGKKIIELRAVVLHWVGPYPCQKPADVRSWWEKGEVYGSAHYIVGADGETMNTLPENEIGYHVGSSQADPASGKLYTGKARRLFGGDVCGSAMNNFYSIGIEMVPVDAGGSFSEAALQAAAELCADILKRHNKTADILTTHYEVVGWKECPLLWAKNPALFEEFKGRVRKLLEGA